MPVDLAAKRRRVGDKNPFYILEPAIDIGSGSSNIGQYYHIKVDDYDKPNDGTTCSDIEDNTYALVHSSHCLEHIPEYETALNNWIRISKKYILVTVPDWEMYERKEWPSTANSDHKWRFSMDQSEEMPGMVNVPNMLKKLKGVKVHWAKRIDDPQWHDQAPGRDWTSTEPRCECVIEFLLEKL